MVDFFDQKVVDFFDLKVVDFFDQEVVDFFDHQTVQKFGHHFDIFLDTTLTFFGAPLWRFKSDQLGIFLGDTWEPGFRRFAIGRDAMEGTKTDRSQTGHLGVFRDIKWNIVWTPNCVFSWRQN